MLILLATATLTVARSRHTGVHRLSIFPGVAWKVVFFALQDFPMLFCPSCYRQSFLFYKPSQKKDLVRRNKIWVCFKLWHPKKRRSKNTQLSTALISASAHFAGPILSMTSSYIIVLIVDTYTIEPMEWSVL